MTKESLDTAHLSRAAKDAAIGVGAGIGVLPLELLVQ